MRLGHVGSGCSAESYRARRDGSAGARDLSKPGGGGSRGAASEASLMARMVRHISEQCGKPARSRLTRDVPWGGVPELPNSTRRSGRRDRDRSPLDLAVCAPLQDQNPRFFCSLFVLMKNRWSTRWTRSSGPTWSRPAATRAMPCAGPSPKRWRGSPPCRRMPATASFGRPDRPTWRASWGGSVKDPGRVLGPLPIALGREEFTSLCHHSGAGFGTPVSPSRNLSAGQPTLPASPACRACEGPLCGSVQEERVGFVGRMTAPEGGARGGTGVPTP